MWMLFLSYSNFLVSPTSSLSARKIMRYHPHPYLHYNYPYIPVYIYIYIPLHILYISYIYSIKYVNITSQFRLVIPIISHGSSWLVTHLPQTHLCLKINQYMCVYIYVYIISYHNILYYIILYYTFHFWLVPDPNFFQVSVLSPSSSAPWHVPLPPPSAAARGSATRGRRRTALPPGWRRGQCQHWGRQREAPVGCRGSQGPTFEGPR